MNERELFEVLMDGLGGREQIRFKCLGPNLVVRGHVVNGDDEKELYETSLSPSLMLAQDLMTTLPSSAMFCAARNLGGYDVSPVNTYFYEEITE